MTTAGGEALPEYPQHRFTLPPGATDVLLVRHGESMPYRADRHVDEWDGHADPELAPDGVEQARRLADRLAGQGVQAIYVTPLRRTLQTAEPLASALGLGIAVEPDLVEVHLGEWERDGAFRRHTTHGHPVAVRVFTEQRWDVIPGAESTEALVTRSRRAIARIAAAHPDERVVVVAHAGVIAAVLASVTGSEPFAFVGVDNGSLSQLVVQDERWSLRRFNDTTHLDRGLSISARPPQ